MLLLPRVRPASRGLQGMVPDRAVSWAHGFESKGAEADEHFEKSNDNGVLPGVNGRSIFTSRKGGRVEQEDHDDF